MSSLEENYRKIVEVAAQNTKINRGHLFEDPAVFDQCCLSLSHSKLRSINNIDLFTRNCFFKILGRASRPHEHRKFSAMAAKPHGKSEVIEYLLNTVEYAERGVHVRIRE